MSSLYAKGHCTQKDQQNKPPFSENLSDQNIIAKSEVSMVQQRPQALKAKQMCSLSTFMAV